MASLARVAVSIVAAGFFAGCAGAFGQTDDFPPKLAKGCETAESCDDLIMEAKDRVARCEPNTIGKIRCADANADLEKASSLKERYLARKAKMDADAKARQPGKSDDPPTGSASSDEDDPPPKPIKKVVPPTPPPPPEPEDPKPR